MRKNIDDLIENMQKTWLDTSQKEEIQKILKIIVTREMQMKTTIRYHSLNKYPSDWQK